MTTNIWSDSNIELKQSELNEHKQISIELYKNQYVAKELANVLVAKKKKSHFQWGCLQILFILMSGEHRAHITFLEVLTPSSYRELGTQVYMVLRESGFSFGA